MTSGSQTLAVAVLAACTGYLVLVLPPQRERAAAVDALRAAEAEQRAADLARLRESHDIHRLQDAAEAMVANAEREQTAEVAAQQRLQRIATDRGEKSRREEPASTFDDFMVHGLS